MSIPMTGAGGLFTRLGAIFAYDVQQQIFQAQVPTLIDYAMQQYSIPDRPAVSGLVVAGQQVLPQIGSIFAASGGTQASAQATVIQMVMDDQPAKATNLNTSMVEVIRQMNLNSVTVAACTVGATPTPLGTNNGNGTVVMSTKAGSGLVKQDVVAEVGPLTCTADAQTGGAVIGQETWQFVGQPAASSGALQTWPGGSGVITSVTGISAYGNAQSTGNLLTNSDFDTWSGSPLALANFSLAVGTWGTDIKQSAVSSNVLTMATYSAQIVGNASGSGVLINLQQQFNSSGGTLGLLTPTREYALNFWAKFDVIPAAGVLTIDMIDQNGNVITDAQSVSNTQAYTLSGFNTTFTSYTAVFRTPNLLPATVTLRIRVTTAISTSSSLFLDNMAFGLMTTLYPGGPNLAIFSGGSQWLKGDGWSLAMTNNRAGQSNLATMQAMFDKYFGMRALGLLLPTAASLTDQQTVSCNYTPTGGTFTLTFTSQGGVAATTAGIAYNANAAAVVSALVALSNIGTGNVTATGGSLPGTGVVVSFVNELTGFQSVMTVNYSGLTGGTPGTMSVAHTQSGVPAVSDGLIGDGT